MSKLTNIFNQLKLIKQNLVKNFENNPTLNQLKTQLQNKINEYKIPLTLKFDEETLQFSLVENGSYGFTFSESYFSFGEPGFEPTIFWFKNQLAFCEMYYLLTNSLKGFNFKNFEKSYLSNIFKFDYEFYDFEIYLNHDDKSKIDCLKIEKRIEDDSFNIILNKYNITLGIGKYGRDDLYLIMASEVNDIDLSDLPTKIIELINTLKDGPKID